MPFTIISMRIFNNVHVCLYLFQHFRYIWANSNFQKKNRVMLLKWCVRDAYFS